jgi:nitrite reductase (NO-forming)
VIVPVAGVGDSTPGRQVFRKCQACHSLEPGKNLLGPSLEGIIGRKAETAPGYSYPPAMQGANVVWDAKTLDAYLAEPEKVVPGNKMPFPGIEDRSGPRGRHRLSGECRRNVGVGPGTYITTG